MDSAEFADWVAGLLNAYRGSGDAGDLRAGVRRARDAIAAVSAGQSGHTGYFNGLRQVLEALFEDTGDFVVLSETVQAARDTVRAATEAGADLSVPYYRLAALVWRLYHHTGRAYVLDEAVRETRVAAADVPGVSRLPGVARETQMLARYIPTVTVLRHPTREAVMAALPSSRVVHFACHGYANSANPGASQLILYDHSTHPLTVADVGRLGLVSELACLSACDSAVTSLDLTDEAIHLLSTWPDTRSSSELCGRSATVPPG